MKEELEALELRFANGEITEAEYQSEKELLLDSMSIDDWLDGKTGIELPDYAESILNTLQPHQEPADFESVFQEVSRGPLVDEGKQGSDLVDDLFMDVLASVETGPLASNRDADIVEDSEPLQFEGQMRQGDTSMVSIEQSDYSTVVESWLDGNYAEGLPEGLANTLTTLQAKVEPSDFETVFAEVSNGPLSDAINVEDVDDHRDVFLDVLSTVEMGPLASQRQSLENYETSPERAAELLLDSTADTSKQANETSTSADPVSNNVIDWTKVLQVSIPSLAAAAALVVVLPGSQSPSGTGLPESDVTPLSISVMANRSGKSTISELEMQMENLIMMPFEVVEQGYLELELEYRDTTDWDAEWLSIAEMLLIQKAVILGLQGEAKDKRLANFVQNARHNVQKLKLRSGMATAEANLAGSTESGTVNLPDHLNMDTLTNQIRNVLQYQKNTSEMIRLLAIADGEIPPKTQSEAECARQLKLLFLELNISPDDIGGE